MSAFQGQWTTLSYHGLFRKGVITQAWPIYDDAISAIQAFQNAKIPASPVWQIYNKMIQTMDVPEWAKRRFFFRGHSDFSFNLYPTMLRNLLIASGREAEQEALEKRCNSQEHFVKTIFNNPTVLQALPGCASWTDSQKLATARHYGCYSEMVDFTANPETAAFFASDSRVSSYSQLGIIYVLDLDQLASISGAGGVRQTPEGFAFTKQPILGTFQLNLRSYDPVNGIKPMTISIDLSTKTPFFFNCILVPGISRINRQKGLFVELKPLEPARLTDYYVEAGELWHLLGFLSLKLCFRKTNQAQKSKTQEEFLPPDDPIQRVIDSDPRIFSS